MNLLCRTALSQVGNSQAVIIPKKFMEVLNIPAKSPVELFESADGILIKPVREWSAEKQSEIIQDIIGFSGSPDDDEKLDPDELIQELRQDTTDDWERLGVK